MWGPRQPTAPASRVNSGTFYRLAGTSRPLITCTTVCADKTVSEHRDTLAGLARKPPTSKPALGSPSASNPSCRPARWGLRSPSQAYRRASPEKPAIRDTVYQRLIKHHIPITLGQHFGTVARLGSLLVDTTTKATFRYNCPPEPPWPACSGHIPVLLLVFGPGSCTA